MERLTISTLEELISRHDIKCNDKTKKGLEELLCYKVLEEQLGMPLEVWHYIYDGNPIYFIGNEKEPVELYLHNDCMGKSFRCSLPRKHSVYVTLQAKDHNRYWFLTREEAEKKLEELKK